MAHIHYTVRYRGERIATGALDLPTLPVDEIDVQNAIVARLGLTEDLVDQCVIAWQIIPLPCTTCSEEELLDEGDDYGLAGTEYEYDDQDLGDVLCFDDDLPEF